MRIVNGRIWKADVRVYPELMQMQIELMIQMQSGDTLFRVPANADVMTHFYQVFSTDSINELNGKFCRVALDDFGNVQYIQDLIYDYESSIIQNNPIV